MYKSNAKQTAARLCTRLCATALTAGILTGCALAAPACVIAQDGLRLRSAASTSSQVLTLLPHNSQLDVIEAVGDSWYRVSTGTQTGFVSSQYVALTTADQTAEQPSEAPADSQPEDTRVFGIVSASSLNVRSGPTTGHSKVSSLSSGAQVEILESLDGWYRVAGGYVSAEYITILDPGVSKLQAEIVAYAHNFLGCAYVLGRSGPTAFDCSGLTQYVYKHFGYSINRGATAQLKNGVVVAKENLLPGDLVFFNNKGTGASVATHVGIYIGNGQFLHASSPKVGVVISDLYSTYYKKVYTTARRII